MPLSSGGLGEAWHFRMAFPAEVAASGSAWGYCGATLRMRPLACPSVLCLRPAPVVDYDALRSEAAGAVTQKVADINVLRTRLVRAERAADDTLAM